MGLQLGCRVFGAGDPPAGLLEGDHLAERAAATGATLVCRDPERARKAGVRPEAIIVRAGDSPTVAQVGTLVDGGYPVLVDLGAAEGPGLLAAISVYAWLGVRVFRVPPGQVADVRQVLDMVGSIKGTRAPTLTRRGLA